MQTHLKVTAVLFLVLSGLLTVGALIASIVFSRFAALAAASPEDGVPAFGAFLGATGIAFAALWVLFAVPSLVCGIGLLKRRRWARVLGIGLASIALLRLPVGTMFGAYVLVILVHPRTAALFTGAALTGRVEPAG